jgi:hypothetical protein
MKKFILLTMLMVGITSATINAQVGINEDNSQPDATAILDVKSTTKGVLIPRMTSTQKAAITTPATGLIVYDNTTSSFWYYNGAAWTEIISDSQTLISDADNDTKIQVEKSANEDIIRFDIGGSEILVLTKSPAGATILGFPNNNSNTFIGEGAGYSTTGSYNVFSGYQAGYNNTTANYNVFSGFKAGYNNTTGSNNVFSGFKAGNSNVGGSSNVFSGYAAGYSNVGGSSNVFSGYKAGYNNTTGSSNVFSGYEAGYNTTGSSNVFSGYQAGYSTTGNNNVFSGHSAGFSNTTGSYNVFSGYAAGYNNKSDGNVFSGFQAGYTNTTGTGNVFIGNNAGYSETGSNKLYIDNSSTATPLIYGDFGDNRVGINRVATTNTLEVGGEASKASPGDWIGNSDARLKKNITPLSSEKVLNQLLALQGITYEWNDDKTGNERPEGIQYGFTAQNIQAVFPTLVDEDNTGYLQTAYGTYDAMTVEAIRALNDKITVLEKENQELKAQVSKINELEKMMVDLQVQLRAKTTANVTETVATEK